MPNSTTGTNVVIFTTSDGTNLTANVLGADVTNPGFNDGIAFGPGNTFYAKRIGSPLLFMAFNLGSAYCDNNPAVSTPLPSLITIISAAWLWM